MSDREIESTTSIDELKPKRINSQTQHGREETADEENIVVLATSFSPVRESSDEVVWHEEWSDVSPIFLSLIFLTMSGVQDEFNMSAKKAIFWEFQSKLQSVASKQLLMNQKLAQIEMLSNAEARSQ